MTTSFPPLRLPVLTALRDLKDQISSDPDALKDAPYDEQTKELLSELFKPTIVENTVEKIVQGDSAGRGRPSKEVQLAPEDMAAVLKGIREEIVKLDTLDAEDGVDVSQKIQIAKTRTALRDQLLKMQERHTNITNTQAFIENIVGIAEELMSEGNREELMRRVDQYR